MVPALRETWQPVYSYTYPENATYQGVRYRVWWDVGTAEAKTGEEVADIVIAGTLNKVVPLAVEVYALGAEGKRWYIRYECYPRPGVAAPAGLPFWAWLLIGAGGFMLFDQLFSGGSSMDVIGAMMPLFVMMFMFMLIPQMVRAVTEAFRKKE